MIAILRAIATFVFFMPIRLISRTPELSFEEAKVVPMRRPGAEAAQCAYPEMKKAAE